MMTPETDSHAADLDLLAVMAVMVVMCCYAHLQSTFSSLRLVFRRANVNFAGEKSLNAMKLKDVADALERFAPLPLQESYDNAGLQIGLTETEDVSGVLLCLDVTESVLDEAVRKGCNLVVAHHPLLFRPLRRVTRETLVERCVVKAVKENVAVYAAHTNLDNAPGGVSFVMAERLGLRDVAFLEPQPGGVGGSGVTGVLPESMSKSDFLRLVANTFGVKALRHNDAPVETVRKVALCGGSGDFLIGKARRQGADAYLTGEIGYHRFFGDEPSLLLAELGHFESEQFTIDLLHRILRDAFPTLKIEKTEQVTNPIQVYNS